MEPSSRPGCLLKDADDEGFLSSEEIKSEEYATTLLTDTAAGAAEMLLPLSAPGMNSHEMSVIPRDDKILLLIALESSWTYMVRNFLGNP